jgi:5-oxopent-3-ene-1,2,5-tricarboxylate decarboxylase/2-hydroxyhepta-2,4-diene-1,7-dioate isomerase
MRPLTSDLSASERANYALRREETHNGTVYACYYLRRLDLSSVTPTLELRTTVNGKLTQHGNTRDLITGVVELIEYLSSFMTLGPGDVILTGTPEGVVDVQPGDEVVCEIEHIGRLVNTIVGDEAFGR